MARRRVSQHAFQARVDLIFRKRYNPARRHIVDACFEQKLFRGDKNILEELFILRNNHLSIPGKIVLLDKILNMIPAF